MTQRSDPMFEVVASSKTYTKVCRLCGNDYQSYRNVRKPGVCGRSECQKAATDEHNAAVAAYQAQMSERRAARRGQPRREPVYVATDWNVLVAFMNGRKQGR